MLNRTEFSDYRPFFKAYLRFNYKLNLKLLRNLVEKTRKNDMSIDYSLFDNRKYLEKYYYNYVKDLKEISTDNFFVR